MRVMCVTILYILLTCSVLHAGWTEPVFIDTTSPLLAGPRILARGDSLAVIYGRDRFKRSLDGGLTWQDEYVLPEGQFPSLWKDLKPQGDTLVIYSIYGPSHLNLAFYYSVDFGQTWLGPRGCEGCYLDYFSAQFDGNLMSISSTAEFTGTLYLANSTDFGVTWPDPESVYFYDDNTIPLLNYFYGFPYILIEYHEYFIGPIVLNLLFSTDGGDSWIHIDSLVTEGTNWFESMDASAGGQIAFVYHDYNNWVGPESWVYVCVSADSGFTWSSPIDLSVSDRNYFPHVALCGDTLVVAFYGFIDSTTEHPSVFVRRSYDLGQIWEPLETLTDPEQRGLFPDVFMDGGKIHIVYHIAYEGVYYRRWERETEIHDLINKPATPLLLSNYPNPFNATTVIEYNLLETGHVEIAVYNICGQRVATLVDGRREAGKHKIVWRSDSYPSGVYFVRLKMPVAATNHKMLLLK